jgi:hypothetical protein
MEDWVLHTKILTSFENIKETTFYTSIYHKFVSRNVTPQHAAEGTEGQ